MSATIIVHHLELSRSTRVLWALEELGLAYELKTYRRHPKTFRAGPEIKAIHPAGRFPVVSIDALVLAESGAILEHLAETYGALAPTEPAERLMRPQEDSLIQLEQREAVAQDQWSSLERAPWQSGTCQQHARAAQDPQEQGCPSIPQTAASAARGAPAPLRTTTCCGPHHARRACCRRRKRSGCGNTCYTRP